MSNLTPRILDLVARLSGQEAPAPASAPPLDRAAMEAAYHHALRRWFALTAQGPTADRAAVARLYQELLRLIDEVGEPTATTLRRQWAREWWQETEVCPFCGARGAYHDQGAGGEPTGEGYQSGAGK